MEDRLERIEKDLVDAHRKLDQSNRMIEKLIDVLERILDGGAGVPMEAVMPDYGATSTAVDSSEFFAAQKAKSQLSNLLHQKTDYDSSMINVIIGSISPALMQSAFEQVDKQGISALSMYVNAPLP